MTIAIMAIFWGCKHEYIYPPVIPIAPGNSGTMLVDTSVCFQRDVLPVFISHCAISGCHDAGTGKEGYILDNYQDIVRHDIRPGNSNGSKLYTIMQSGEMPRYPAPQVTGTELYNVKHWIDMGAHNDTNCSGNCDTSVYTYSLAIKPILNSYCIGCHSTAAASSSGGGFILDTYTGVQAVALNGKLLGSVQHASGYPAMPLGISKLSDCEITQISEWINAGAQNN
jgi:hypothetical protein